AKESGGSASVEKEIEKPAGSQEQRAEPLEKAVEARKPAAVPEKQPVVEPMEAEKPTAVPEKQPVEPMEAVEAEQSAVVKALKARQKPPAPFKSRGDVSSYLYIDRWMCEPIAVENIHAFGKLRAAGQLNLRQMGFQGRMYSGFHQHLYDVVGNYHFLPPVFEELRNAGMQSYATSRAAFTLPNLERSLIRSGLPLANIDQRLVEDREAVYRELGVPRVDAKKFMNAVLFADFQDKANAKYVHILEKRKGYVEAQLQTFLCQRKERRIVDEMQQSRLGQVVSWEHDGLVVAPFHTPADFDLAAWQKKALEDSDWLETEKVRRKLTGYLATGIDNAVILSATPPKWKGMPPAVAHRTAAMRVIAKSALQGKLYDAVFMRKLNGEAYRRFVMFRNGKVMDRDDYSGLFEQLDSKLGDLVTSLQAVRDFEAGLTDYLEDSTLPVELQEQLAALFGTYSIYLGHELLSCPAKGLESASPARMRLQGTRLVTFSEMERAAAVHSSIFKQWSEHCTRVQARNLFSDIVEFQVQFGMILSTNKSISFTDLDGGVERRLSIVPWPMRFTRTEPNVLAGRAPGLMWLLMKIARIFSRTATPLS
ncbi:unnamed protein product, partial [Effrenium voratum]